LCKGRNKVQEINVDKGLTVGNMGVEW